MKTSQISADPYGIYSPIRQHRPPHTQAQAQAQAQAPPTMTELQKCKKHFDPDPVSLARNGGMKHQTDSKE
jgi:hypothetical protein